MQNSRLPFVLLFLGLAVLSYQFLFHPNVSEQSFSRRFKVGLGDLAQDQSDLKVNPTIKTFAKPHHTQVAGLAPAAPVQVQTPPVAPTPPALTAAPVDMKALAKATDEKAKADAKKKKKKKKTVNPNPETSAQMSVPAAPVAAPAAPEVPPAPVAPPTYQAQASPQGNNNSGAAKTNALVQYYENSLLKNPDTAETQKFVAAHKAKQVSDEVYFAVAAKMMADTRLQMKDLAVYVYGQTVDVKSFEALVTVIDTDTANDVVKTDSLRYLNSYSDVTTSGGVSVLASAIAAPLTTPSLHLEALKLLDTATKQFAQLEVNPPIGNGPINTQAYNPGSAQKLFVPFVSLLNNLVRSGADSNTKNIASQDLTDLQSLLGNESASINP